MPSPDLISRIRACIRARHFSQQTEAAYVQWARRFVEFCGFRHPKDLTCVDLERFLVSLATQGHLSASTQNQARAAILFLLGEVLHLDVSSTPSIVRAKVPRRRPVVLTREEVARVLGHLSETPRIIASLLYGSGLRLSEALRLRVMDLDFGYRHIVVREGKGMKDRVTPLPDSLRASLHTHLRKLRTLYETDRARRNSVVAVPQSVRARQPKAAGAWGWYFIFPAKALRRDPASGQWIRVPAHPKHLQRAVQDAVVAAGVHKRATCHTFRHCFATHMLEDGCDIRTLQTLLGHADVRTATIWILTRS